jgi:hypothetical protein
MSMGIAIGIAILLNQEYRYRYRRYFYAEISLSVSAILLLSIFNNPADMYSATADDESAVTLFCYTEVDKSNSEAVKLER